MGLKDFIKNNIYESDNKPVEPTKPRFPTPTSSAPSYIRHMGTATITGSNVLVGNNAYIDTFRQKLVDLLKTKKPAGIGYFEYIQSKNAMSSIPDEAVRYSTAYAALTSVGLTKQNIINTANASTDLIKSEVQTFEAQYAIAYKAKVQDKRDAVNGKQQQIQLLTQQINDLNASLATMTDDAADAEKNLNTQHDAFLAAADEEKTTIQTELEKINQYIQ